MTMQSRPARVAAGADGQAELKSLLEMRYGFTVVPTGQEFWLPAAAHDVLRRVHDDVTVRAVRYVPDLLAWGQGFPFSFWDAKVNQTPGTSNFSIESACYDEGMARWSIGQRVVLAFRDVDRSPALPAASRQTTGNAWYAQAVQHLVVVADNSDRRHEAAGSHTPYLLVRKDSTVRLSAFVAQPRW